MSKLFIAFLFALIFISPHPASAKFIDQISGIGDFSKYKFAVNATNTDNPQDMITNTSTINVNVTAWDNNGPASAFSTSEYYYIRLDKAGYSCITNIDSSTSKGTFYGNTASTKGQSSTEINFTVNPVKSLASLNFFCNLESGTYKLSMWSKTSKTSIFENVDFPVNGAAGGGDASMTYVSDDQNLICHDKKPPAKVVLTNLVKDQVYRLWWDGHTANWAWKQPATAKSMTIDVGLGDDYFKKDENNYLCLAVGDTIAPPAIAPGGQCSQAGTNAYLPFYYPEDQSACDQVKPASCSHKILQSENNTDKKQVMIIGTNLPIAVSDLRADIVYRSQNPPLVVPVTDLGTTAGSGNELNWTIELANNADYGVYIYPKDGSERICTEEFTLDNSVNTGNSDHSNNTSTDQTAFSLSADCKADQNGNCTSSKAIYCDSNKTKIRTAVGCVPTDVKTFLPLLMKYIMGLSGGIALLLMIFGSFQMITSGGNADGLKKGREQFISAVIGLLFVIFSILLMQIIGVDILGLPGLT